MMKYKKMIGDFLLNLIANTLNVGFLQIILFPIISRNINTSSFGQITAIYGINSIVFLFLGSALGTLRLTKMEKSGVNYTYLSYQTSIIAFLIALIIFNIYGASLNKFDVFMYCITAGLMSYLSYGGVIYRLYINYKKVVIQNVVIFLGYLIGLLLFFLTKHWSLIFLLGNVFGVIYTHKFSQLSQDSTRKNSEFRYVVREYANLSIATLISSSTGNLDRIILIPLLGNSSMAIFFAASSVSKILNLVINPLANVLLTYISNEEIEMGFSKLSKIQFLTFMVGIILSFPAYMVSILMVKFLYPTIYNGYDHIQLLTYIVSLGTIFLSLWSLLNALFLKIFNMKFQLASNTLYGIFYLVLSISLGTNYGLLGFGIAFTISSIFKFLISWMLSLVKSLK